MGSTLLTCHVHEGTETCNSCEPGLTLAASSSSNNVTSSSSSAPAPVALSREDREKERKRLQKAIKKKYAIEQAGHPGGAAPRITGEYKDRAEERRQKVGVDDLGAKYEEASVDQ
jgi:hypothetical protein